MDVDVCPTDGVATVTESYLEGDDTDAAVGKVFSGRYRIERLLGTGGFGRVYEATQLSMSRPVALKTLHPELVSNRTHLQRFYQEAQAASALTNAHVVRIYDFGVDDKTKTPYIAMEFLAGAELGDVIEEKAPLDVRTTAKVLGQASLALLEAGEAGIVHRDFKPSNIFLTDGPRGRIHVKVMDFGIAKVLNPESGNQESLTGTGISIGTPTYMAPEQVMGRTVDFRTDLYALGCILHEMLMGEPPFSSEDRMGVLMQHINEEPPLLPDLLPSGDTCPRALQILCKSLLAKDPNDRPPDGNVVVELFNAVERGDDVDALSMLRTASGTALVAAADDETLSGALPPSAQETAALPSAGEAGAKLTDVTRSPPELGPKPGDKSSATGLTELEAMDAQLTPWRSPKVRVGMGLAAALLVGITVVMAWPGDKAPEETSPAPTAQEPQAPDRAGAAALEEPGPTQGAESEKPEGGGAAETAEGAPAAGDEKPEGSEQPAEAARAAAEEQKKPEPPVKRSLLLLTTTPEGAKVFRGEELLCLTPCNVRVPAATQPETLRLSRDGYEDEDVELYLGADLEVRRTVKLYKPGEKEAAARKAAAKKAAAKKAAAKKKTKRTTRKKKAEPAPPAAAKPEAKKPRRTLPGIRLKGSSGGGGLPGLKTRTKEEEAL